jgi:Mitochondrial inner membrane protein
VNQRKEPPGDPIDVEAELVKPRRGARRWLIAIIVLGGLLGIGALALNISEADLRRLADIMRGPPPVANAEFTPAPADNSVQQAPKPESRPAMAVETVRPPTATGEGAALMLVVERLAALDKRMAQIEERLDRPSPPDPVLAARIKALEQEMAAIGEQRAARVGRQVGLTLAVGQLRDAVGRGQPFAAELQAVERMGENDPAALAALRPLAERGVATLADLNTRFRGVAREVARAGAGVPDPPWWQRILQRLTALASIRRVGVVSGDEADAVAARAEVRMASGDVAGALAELERLSGGAAQAAAAWREDAGQHVAAARAMAALDRAAIGRLADERAPK